MLIAEIEKNGNECMRVYITEYQGQRYIDCRVYFMDKEERWNPTKKGITLSKGNVSKIIKALELAKSTLKKLDAGEHVDEPGTKVDLSSIKKKIKDEPEPEMN